VLDAQGRVRVVDFGIARVEQEAGAALTAAGVVVGSAAYLAPEQASGGRVDHRADLYALGCVLLALLTGRPPFSGESPVTVAAQHLHADPPDLAALRPDAPASLIELVRDLLAKDPRRRPVAAQEVADRLGDLASVGEVTAVVPAAGVTNPDPTATAVLPGAAATGAPVAARRGTAAADERLGTRRIGLATAAVLALVGLLIAAATLGVLSGGTTSALTPRPRPRHPSWRRSRRHHQHRSRSRTPPRKPSRARWRTSRATRSRQTPRRPWSPCARPLQASGRTVAERSVTWGVASTGWSPPSGTGTGTRPATGSRASRRRLEDLEEDGRLSPGSGQAVLEAADGLRSALRTLDGGGGRDRDRDDD
jgi:eukaryotic-like serine/threonine-protein kinase